MNTERKYHVVAISEKTGKVTVMTAYPVSHSEACVNMSKLTVHPCRRIQLQEAK